MKKQSYKNIEDFIGEFSEVKSKKYKHIHTLDFKFKGKEYRVTKRQIETDEERKTFKEKDRFISFYNIEIALVDPNIKSKFQSGKYHILDWYRDAFCLLKYCEIDNEKFSDVICSKNTIILTKYYEEY